LIKVHSLLQLGTARTHVVPHYRFSFWAMAILPLGHSMDTDTAKKSMFQISFKFSMWKLHLFLNSTTFVDQQN